MDDNCVLVQQLNDNISNDFSSLNLFPTNNDVNDNPCANINIKSSYYDDNSFKTPLQVLKNQSF